MRCGRRFAVSAGTDNEAHSVDETRAAFDAAVANFTSAGCDAVALYPYARGSAIDQGTVDWSMADLLPFMLDRLRQRGWDPNVQPVIGIPQTFELADGVSPDESSVAAQMAAYCRAGAHTILFYAWNDSFGGPKTELFSGGALRQAPKQACPAAGRCGWQLPQPPITP